MKWNDNAHILRHRRQFLINVNLERFIKPLCSRIDELGGVLGVQLVVLFHELLYLVRHTTQHPKPMS